MRGRCAEIKMTGVDAPCSMELNVLHTKIGEGNFLEKLWGLLWCCCREMELFAVQPIGVYEIAEVWSTSVEKHPFLIEDSWKFQESRGKLPVTWADFEKVQKTSFYFPVHWCQYSQWLCCSGRLWMEKELKLKWKINTTSTIFKARLCCYGFFPRNFYPSVHKTFCPGHISILPVKVISHPVECR